MQKRLLPLLGLLLVTIRAFAETTPVASRLTAAQSTYTTVASSPNPSTVGTSVTFTSTTKYSDFYSDVLVTEGTVTFSEGATVLAADVPVAAGVASFSTTTLSAGTHVITATYNGTANYATSAGSIAQTVDDPGSCPTYTNNIAYVNASATVGTNDGTTWARAFLTLQAALDAARTCGVTQIWVAQGTYVPTAYPIGVTTTRYSGEFTSADFSFHLVNGVAIYGGFNGTETQLSQRNWRQNPTILSGNNARYHVVTSISDGSNTRLDGFTVTGGNANGGGGLTVEGGGINRSSGGGVVMQSSSPRLENLVVTGNAASSIGGISAYNGSPTLTNVAVLNHSTGGMAYVTAGSGFVITITNAVFAGNSGNGGGGLQVNGFTMTANLTNVVFANNTASRGGGLVNAACTTNLVNCTFYNNSTDVSGGAMYNVNGATVTDKNGIYYNNTNNGNTAYNGVLNFSIDTFTATTTLTGTDPKFVNAADPDGPDNVWMTADDGLSIASNSPAINAGTAAGAPTTDIRGFARTGNPDQGAYEYTACVTPTAFAVTGGGGYCAGGSGVAIGLSGSETGVNYQLKLNNTNVGSAVSGTGSAFSFGTFTTAGTYTVVASRSETCTANMTGSATVTVNPLPTASVVVVAAAICAGGNAEFTITGTPNATVTYNRNGGTNTTVSLDGNGSVSLSAQNVQQAGPVTLNLISVKDNTTQCTQSLTGSATVTVNPNPVLSSVSASPNPVCDQQTLTLSAQASGGTGSLSYAWSGPNGYAASTIPATRTVGSGDGGVYSVTVTDANGCQASGQTASVSVTPKTDITGITPSQAICGGQPFQVSVQANGSGLTYQWYRRTGATTTQLIAGATSAAPTIPVQFLPGNLFVIVSGACGKDTAFVTLTFKAPTLLQWTAGTVSQVCEGNTLTLSVTGSGPGSLAYAWRKDGGPVLGTGSSLTIANAQLADAGSYACTLTSECQSVTLSTPVVVRYLRISQQPPATVNLCAGSTVLTVGVQAVGLTPTYQWRRNGSVIAGATSASLTVLASRAGTYTVEVRSACGNLLSQASVVGCGNSRLSAEEAELVVQPNPVRGSEIRVRVAGMDNPGFSLTTSTGRSVGTVVKPNPESSGGEWVLTPRQSLTPGVYVLQAQEGAIRLTTRVLVVNE